MTVYLYIPFAKDEGNKQLLKMAQNWAKLYELKQLGELPSQDEPEIVDVVICTYGDKKIGNVKAGDKVYVLAHGLAKKTQVTSEPLTEATNITQATVAQRMIEDGLPSDLAFKLKLYYCDESSNAFVRTEELFNGLKALKPGFDKVDLYYYPGVALSGPELPKENASLKSAYKKAFISKKLADFEVNDLKRYIMTMVVNMEKEQLKTFLASLGLEIIMKFIQHADKNTLSVIKQKAQISSAEHFLSSLDQSQSYITKVYIEMGKAKEFRKKFKK